MRLRLSMSKFRFQTTLGPFLTNQGISPVLRLGNPSCLSLQVHECHTSQWRAKPGREQRGRERLILFLTFKILFCSPLLPTALQPLNLNYGSLQSVYHTHGTLLWSRLCHFSIDRKKIIRNSIQRFTKSSAVENFS